MDSWQSLKRKFVFFLHWSRGRMSEVWSGTFTPASRGLGLEDAALAMASVRQDMQSVKKLMSLGANPSVNDFLVYRMAAAAGSLDVMLAIEATMTPSKYAKEDAFAWASFNKRELVTEHLISA